MAMPRLAVWCAWNAARRPLCAPDRQPWHGHGHHLEQIINEVMCRSMADLAMLTTDTARGPYPYALSPWYSATFGRDGIMAALRMLWCDSRYRQGCAAAARHLSSHRILDPLTLLFKIPHEMRGGEMAALREVPFGLYFGSADADTVLGGVRARNVPLT